MANPDWKNSAEQTLAEIKASIDGLPAAQQLWIKAQLGEALLAHLLGNTEIKLPERPVEISADLRRDLFQQTYKIEIHADNKVSFTLPPGKSRLDLIKEASTLAKELYGMKAICFNRFKRWSKDPAFLKIAGKNSIMRTICGYVKNSEKKRKSGNTSRRINNVCLEDLVTAHSAFLVITGRDIFNNHPVMAKDGIVLNYLRYGLVYSPNAKNYDVTPVAACRRVKNKGPETNNIISIETDRDFSS